MSDNTETNVGSITLWSVFSIITGLWSVFNYNTLLGYVYSLEHPLRELFIYFAYAAIIWGVIEVIAIGILVLVLLWTFAGLTS
jgi:hypothetical protein